MLVKYADKEEFEKMEKDKEYKLSVGDTFTIYLDEFPIKVKKINGISSTSSSNSSSFLLGKKRRAEQTLHKEDDDEDSMEYETRNKETHDEALDDNWEYSIAFPSISTGTFMFDAPKAAKIACKVNVMSTFREFSSQI
jgi:hypothetical protein